MAEQHKPTGIRVAVPDEFGSVYDNADGSRQYVERRQQVGKAAVAELKNLVELLKEEERFEKVCEVFQSVYLDWDLADSVDGPLPKPWQNPEAFKLLIDMDINLALWTVGLIHAPMSRLIPLLAEDDLKN